MITFDDATLRNQAEALVNRTTLIDASTLKGIRDFADARQLEEKRKTAVGLIVELTTKSLERFFPDLESYSSVREYIEEFSRYEELLYSTQSTYRDHIAHTLRDFLLGEILLFEHGIAKLLRIDQDLIEPAWCLAALLHDFGYPVETQHQVTSSVARMLDKVSGLLFRAPEIIFQPPTTMLFETFLREMSRNNMVSFYDMVDEMVLSPPEGIVEILERYGKPSIGFGYPWLFPALHQPTISLEAPPFTWPLFAPEPKKPTIEELDERTKALQRNQENLNRTTKSTLERLEKRTTTLERLQGIATYESAIVWDIYFMLLESLKQYRHGVISALLFLQMFESEIRPRFLRPLKTYQYLRGADRATRDEIYKVDLIFEIALSMALHSLRFGTGYRISLRNRPLEFLLAFCDEIQEWGRPARTLGLFVPQTTLLESIRLDVAGGKTPTIRVEFDFQERGNVESFPQFTEWEFYRRKSERLGRLMTDNMLKLEVTTIPRVSEFEHLRELKVVTCAKCGEVYPQQVSDRKSGEIRESDVRGFAHTCES